MLTRIMVRMEDAGKTKRAIFDYFMEVARKVGEKILNGETVGLKDRMLYALGEFCVYGPLKNRMGLTRMKVGYTAGEASGQRSSASSVRSASTSSSSTARPRPAST